MVFPHWQEKAWSNLIGQIVAMKEPKIQVVPNKGNLAWKSFGSKHKAFSKINYSLNNIK